MFGVDSIIIQISL